MLIYVKILKGGECTIEVSATASINSVKQMVAEQLQIPVDQQRLVFKGKTLLDSESLCDYNIVDGNKLHLFIREKTQPQGSPGFVDMLRKFLEKHYSPADANKVLEVFLDTLSTQVNSMSLDDIESLATIRLGFPKDDEQSFSQFSSGATAMHH